MTSIFPAAADQNVMRSAAEPPDLTPRCCSYITHHRTEAAQQWRTSLSVISLLLILSSAVFGYGSYIASNAQMEDNAKDSAPVSDTGEGEDGGGGGRSRRHDRSDNDVEGSVGGDDSVTPLLGAEVSSSSGDAAGLLASLQPSSQAAAISAGLPSDGSAYRSSGVGGGVLREVGGSLLGGSRGRV